MSASDLGGEIPGDPRSAVNGPLRAADTDRDIAPRVPREVPAADSDEDRA